MALGRLGLSHSAVPPRHISLKGRRWLEGRKEHTELAKLGECALDLTSPLLALSL